MLQECRCPQIVMLRGAYLGEEMLMVQELMDRDLWAALGDSRQQKQLRWDNR